METVRMKKKKGGRPTKALKRELRITARFSKLEHYILQQKAGKAGINVSEFIRQAAITAKVLARQTAEERDSTRKLIGMANNFNQMAKPRSGTARTGNENYYQPLIDLNIRF